MKEAKVTGNKYLVREKYLVGERKSKITVNKKMII